MSHYEMWKWHQSTSRAHNQVVLNLIVSQSQASQTFAARPKQLHAITGRQNKLSPLVAMVSVKDLQTSALHWSAGCLAQEFLCQTIQALACLTLSIIFDCSARAWSMSCATKI